MRSEKRRAIFEAVVAKHEKLGDKFEDNQGFRALVEEWIAGAPEIDELPQRYRILHECAEMQNSSGILGSPRRPLHP
jgi:hypothetical protein